MGRGGRTESKCGGNARLRVKNMESEDSDEDYVAEADEVNDQSEELDSFVEDSSEEGSCFEEVAEGEGEGEEEEEVYEEEEEEEEGEEEEEEEGDEEEEKEEEEEEEEEEEREEVEEEEEDWRTKINRVRKVKGSTRTRRARGSTRTRRDKGSATRKRSTRPRKNGVRRPKKKSRVRSDNDEDSDDSDEEFTPDGGYTEEEEEYFDEEEEEEEEEFSLLKKNTRKRGRAKITKKSYVKSRKKRSAKAARKPPAKKSKKTSSLRRRTRSGDDEDFLDKGPTLRDRSRKKSAHRKKRATESDSEFCSDSSDFEFTISEEEREQVGEANQICGSRAMNLRSSRKKQEDEAFYETKTTLVRHVRKGKEKAEEKKNDVGKAVCGICLTEEGKNTVRGTLNCCSHYFCFACIFEWSKVETRCPLCKQRFVSISKPARCVRGFDLRDTVIAVPERDQVYQPSEEELRDFLNPYENVICTECHQGGDDALMLLCDLCDSPAHTYCVGLGHEVPEGNWYCDGCRPAALGTSHSQTQDLTLDQSSTGMSDRTSTYENMAEIDLNVTIPETPVSQGNSFFPSPRFPNGSLQAPSPASGMGVSTVSGRRLIHEQIRRHILSNRFSQISPGADTSVLGNLAGRGFNAGQQHNGMTDIGPSHHTQYVDRLQENPSHSVQSGDSFPVRLGHMMRGVGQPSTSVNVYAHSQGQWSELNRLNLGGSQSQITVGTQLNPCTSSSCVGAENGVSSADPRYEEHASSLKQQVQTMVRSQLKSLSRDLNLGKFIALSYHLYHILGY